MKKHDVEQIIKAFSKKYGKQAKEIENAIRKAMANGMSIAEAVKEATKETEAWMTSHVMESMLLSVSAGSGVNFEELPPALTNAWDASGMKLSKKIHGTTKEMRSAIISTLCKAQKDGKKVIETARALYDGYGYGHVTRTQPLPDYLDKVLTYARRMDLSDKDKDALMREIRNAKRATERLSQNNAPNRTLKAVYKELVTHIERSEDRMMERSLKAAVEEKSRYIAERIARTESARAWADGFIARYGDDEDVVAYQWKTGSRHPEEDICDMYANANLWNLGKGIFPKDKCPILPIHPHCLCHLAPVFISEVDIDNAQDQRDVATCDWLKRQNENTRENLLGVKGNKAWEEGRKTWRTVLRNYSPKVMKSRIVTTLDGNLQHYNPIEKTGETITIGKARASIINAVKIKNANWDMFVSDEVALKPRKLHELNQNLKNALTLINAKTEYIKPKIIIINSEQSLNSVAAYRARDNTMFLVNLTSTVEKAVGKQFVDGNESLSTVVHELLHWKDAQLFREKYGDIDTREQQERYIAFVNNRARRKLDAIKKNGYDIEKEGSMYERNSFEKKVFDEAYTEYRTRTLIKRR